MKGTSAQKDVQPFFKRTMPVSGYLAFANAKRNEVREALLAIPENEGKVGIAKLGKELGARWRQLSDEEKETYKQLAIEQANAKKAAAGEQDDKGTSENTAEAKPSRQGLPTSVVKRLVL